MNIPLQTSSFTSYLLLSFSLLLGDESEIVIGCMILPPSACFGANQATKLLSVCEVFKVAEAKRYECCRLGAEPGLDVSLSVNCPTVLSARHIKPDSHALSALMI